VLRGTYTSWAISGPVKRRALVRAAHELPISAAT